MGQKVLIFKNLQDFKINFFETSRCKIAEIELKKNCNKSFKAVEQGLQLHQSSQNIAYFQKYSLFN